MFGFPSRSKDPARRPAFRVEQLEDRAVPALFAIGDTYSVASGAVLTIAAPQGLSANDFSDTFPGQVLTVNTQPFTAPRYVPGVGTPIPTPPLPQPNLFLNEDGSFIFIAPPDDLIPQGVNQVT